MARRRDNPQEFDPKDFQPLIDTFARLNRRMQVVVVAVLLVVGVIAVVVYFRQQQINQTAQTKAATESPNLVLGNPSGATPDPSNRDNYLMPKPYFVIGYNDSRGEPNWVSWRVTAADLGDAPRKQEFDADDTLPAGFNRVVTRDYSGSGFDRGHMCPHSDRAANTDMSYATFVMSNIIPQAPNVNRKAWAQLEVYGRELVRRGARLYIIAGPSSRGGVGSRGSREDLANGRVTVPKECWKIIVVVSDGGLPEGDRGRISAASRVIAVIMPNDENAVGEEWAGFRTSVAEIERHTGYRFFDTLLPDVAEALRQKVDDVYIAPPRPLTHTGD